MERVKKGFVVFGVIHIPGEVGDFSALKNFRSLLAQRYLETFTGKPAVCKECDRKFDNTGSLLAHLNLYHPDKLVKERKGVIVNE